MYNIMVKAYAYMENTSQECFTDVINVLNSWFIEESICDFDDNNLSIHYEGEYFPHEEIAVVFARYLHKDSRGKLDYIDLENWKLTRYFLDKEHNSILLQQKEEQTIKEKDYLPYHKTSSLDHALEASQQKSQEFKHAHE